MLAVLGETKVEAARGLLLSIGLGGDAETASEAAELLVGMSDFQYYRPAFLKSAATGDRGSIIALARIPDDETRRLLNELTADTTYVGALAREVLELQSLPDTPDWPKAFEEAIKGSTTTRKQQVWWALEAAATKPVPGMLTLIRDRLDRSKTSYRERFAAENEKLRADPGKLDAAFNREFQEGYEIDRVDRYYGHVLLAYSKLGGALSPIEQGRLELMGYGCDPKKRLESSLGGNAFAEARDREIRKMLEEKPQDIPEWFRKYSR
jgi:hypothetical protein